VNIGAAALIGALVYAGINFIKYVKAKDRSASLTQIAVWALGVGVLFLAAWAKVTNTFMFNGITLEKMDTGSKIVLGLMAASLFATIPYDLKRAIDNNDSATTPPLLGTAVAVVQSTVKTRRTKPPTTTTTT
jgi:hypothetical protein